MNALHDATLNQDPLPQGFVALWEVQQKTHKKYKITETSMRMFKDSVSPTQKGKKKRTEKVGNSSLQKMGTSIHSKGKHTHVFKKKNATELERQLESYLAVSDALESAKKVKQTKYQTRTRGKTVLLPLHSKRHDGEFSSICQPWQQHCGFFSVFRRRDVLRLEHVKTAIAAPTFTPAEADLREIHSLCPPMSLFFSDFPLSSKPFPLFAFD